MAPSKRDQTKTHTQYHIRIHSRTHMETEVIDGKLKRVRDLRNHHYDALVSLNTIPYSTEEYMI